MDLFEFETSLVHRVNSRTGLHGENPSPKQNKKKEKRIYLCYSDTCLLQLLEKDWGGALSQVAELELKDSDFVSCLLSVCMCMTQGKVCPNC